MVLNSGHLRDDIADSEKSQDQNPVLKVFLDQLLNQGIIGSDFRGQLTYLLEIQLRASNHQKHHYKYQPEQRRLQEQHVDRSGSQLEQGDPDSRNPLAEKLRHDPYILLQTVDGVAGVEFFLPLPAGTEHMGEEILPQTVAALHGIQVLDV